MVIDCFENIENIGGRCVEDIVKLYWKLKDIAEQNGNQVAQKLNIRRDEGASGFFGMAYNDVVLTLELLDYYYRIWEKNYIVGDNKEVIRQENAERVIKIEKMCFIQIMSSFEYSAKQIALSNNRFDTLKKNARLVDIITKSKEIGVIDEEKERLWNGIRLFRNSIVHNNGISIITECYNYPEVILNLDKNKMTQGNLKLFALLTKWVLDEVKLWILAVSSSERN